jgi:hypothetical protein
VFVGALTSIVAAILPVAALVHTWSKERAALSLEDKRASIEAAARDAQQAHAIQLAYFEKAIDPERSPLLRLAVLRFLGRSQRIDTDIAEWARDEIAPLEQIVKAEEFSTQAKVASEAAALNEAELAAARPGVDAGQTESRQRALSEHRERLARLEERLGEVKSVLPARGNCSASAASMRTDLRSGVDEQSGTQACREAAAAHRPGGRWIVRVKGKTIECECTS